MICKNCQREFKQTHKLQKYCSKGCSHQYWNKWKRNNAEYKKKESVKMTKKIKEIRMEALNIIGKGNILQCSNCGIKDIRLLEINHMDGGGTKEIKEQGGSPRLYYKIVKGKRNIDDLNILCKVCNRAHFIKLKYGIEFIVYPKSN